MKISIKDISIIKEKALFKELNLDFQEGLNVIKGESGVGKTTLLRLLLGLEIPEKGTITYDDQELKPQSLEPIRSEISWVPQSFKQFQDVEVSFLLEQLNLDIGEFVQNLNYFNMEYTSKPLSEYSVGEIQRIFLSIAKTQDRSILIADEPSSALDSANKIQLIKYLKNHKGTVICVSHDEDIIKIADKIIEL